MPDTIVATAFGGPEVLSLIDEPLGERGPGQVLIDVRAVGTNPVDFKRYSGAMGNDPSLLPLHLGFEAAGVVLEASNEAHGPAGPIHVGDEVIVYRVDSAYAAQLLVPTSSVVPKPSTLSFAEASGLMLAGSTAIHALKATGVKPGDTVLVHGAAGGVGLMAVQLAVGYGARVIGTAGEASHGLLRELRSEPVRYGDGLRERIEALAPDGINVAIDAVGTEEALDVSLELVADRDRIATVVNFDRGLEAGIKVLGGRPGADAGVEIRNAARLELVSLAEAGRIHVRVAGTYPLKDAALAHRELASGHTHGKIVLIP
jgi:NADPH:quinone reductase-like Zn-dependent oxidoreductase